MRPAPQSVSPIPMEHQGLGWMRSGVLLTLTEFSLSGSVGRSTTCVFPSLAGTCSRGCAPAL